MTNKAMVALAVLFAGTGCGRSNFLLGGTWKLQRDPSGVMNEVCASAMSFTGGEMTSVSRGGNGSFPVQYNIQPEDIYVTTDVGFSWGYRQVERNKMVNSEGSCTYVRS